MAVTSVLFSGSTNGAPIQLTGTAFASKTTIHAAHATAHDELYLFANNTSGTAADVSVIVLASGNDVDADGKYLVKTFSVPAKSPSIAIVQGIRVTGSVDVKAYPSSANVINISGYVTRIP